MSELEILSGEYNKIENYRIHNRPEFHALPKKKEEGTAILTNTLTASAMGVIEGEYIIPKFWHLFRDSPHSYHFGLLMLLYAGAVSPVLLEHNVFSPREEGETKRGYLKRHLSNTAKLILHSCLWSSIFDIASYIMSNGFKEGEWVKNIYPELELFGKQLTQFPVINVYNSILLALFSAYISYIKRDSIKSTFTKSYNVLSSFNKGILSRIIPEHCKGDLKDSAVYQKLNKFETILYI